MDSDKGSIDMKPNAPVEIVEDCLSDETIRHSDLFLPGVHFDGGGECADTTSIASGEVKTSRTCTAPDKSFGLNVKYAGSYSSEHIEGLIAMDGFHKPTNGRIDMEAKVVSRYVGACS
jgi:hypothetical protein